MRYYDSLLVNCLRCSTLPWLWFKFLFSLIYSTDLKSLHILHPIENKRCSIQRTCDSSIQQLKHSGPLAVQQSSSLPVQRHRGLAVWRPWQPGSLQSRSLATWSWFYLHQSSDLTTRDWCQCVFGVVYLLYYLCLNKVVRILWKCPITVLDISTF